MFIDKHIKNNSNKHSINSLKGVLKKKIPPIVFTEDLGVKIDEERAKQIGIMLKENTIEKCRHRMLSRSVDIEDSDKNTLNSIRLQFLVGNLRISIFFLLDGVLLMTRQPLTFGNLRHAIKRGTI